MNKEKVLILSKKRDFRGHKAIKIGLKRVSES